MSLNSSTIVIPAPAFFNASICPQTQTLNSHMITQPLYQPNPPQPTQPTQPKQPCNCSSISDAEQISLSTYLVNVKKQIQNKELENEENTLHKVATIFITETQKDTTAVIKVIIACINVVCLILHHKKPLSKRVANVVINAKFIGGMLRFGVERVLQENVGIESSLCYLLQLCYEQRLFDCPKAKGLISLYKEYALGLLQNISSNPKVVFNTFKIVDFLQRSDLLTTEDYVRHRIIPTIKHKTTNCKAGSFTLYELAFKLLIVNTNNTEDATSLLNSLNSNSSSSGGSSSSCSSQAFFKVGSSSSSSRPLSSSSFFQILSQQLFQQRQQQQKQQQRQGNQQFFFRWLEKQLRVIQPFDFLKLLETNVIEATVQKLRQIVSSTAINQQADENNGVSDVMNALMRIQLRSKEFNLESAVKDKIECSMSFSKAESEERGEGLPSQSQF